MKTIFSEHFIKNFMISAFCLLLGTGAAMFFHGCGYDSSRMEDLPKKLTGSTWMDYYSDIIGERRLNDIAIPGTHDSGTYSINRDSDWADDGKGDPAEKWVNHQSGKWYGDILADALDFLLDRDKEITSWWSKTQRNSFKQQLSDGIRYFDLRIQQKDGDWLITHALLGTSIKNLFTAIQDFYKNSESGNEILLLDFQHTFHMHHETFISYLKSALKDSAGNSILIPRGADLTLNSIWATNKRVLVFYDNDDTVDKHTELWRSSSSKKDAQIMSVWPNTNSGSTLKSKLTKYLNDKTTEHYQWSGNFVVLQAITTEGTAELGCSMMSLACNEFCDDWILGPILRRLGWDKDCPMNFLDWNPGLGALNQWFSNADNYALAGNRAGIIIIDDYANLSYTTPGGEKANYAKLVYNLNQVRDAPSPTGPYKAVIRSQTPNFRAKHYQYSEVEIRFTNVGEIAWDPSVVRLGTSDPHDRTTNLKAPGDSRWLSETRIAMTNTEPVQPGQDAIFQFSIYPDYNYATSYQTFELVADSPYEGVLAQWFGEYQGSTSIHIMTDPLVYKAQLKSQSPALTMPQFDIREVFVTYTNTGNMPWFSDVVRLAPINDFNWNKLFYFYNPEDQNWVGFDTDYARIQMVDGGPVMSGQDGTFRFTLKGNFGAESSGIWFLPVADKALGQAPDGWFPDDETCVLSVDMLYAVDPMTGNVVTDNVSAQLVFKTPDFTVKRGASGTVHAVFNNTGKIVWPPDVVCLVTANPKRRDSHLYSSDGNWFSPQFIHMINNDPVRPGQQATFEFTATPDDQFVTGDEAFQLLIFLPGVNSWDIPGGSVSYNVTVTD